MGAAPAGDKSAGAVCVVCADFQSGDFFRIHNGGFRPDSGGRPGGGVKQHLPVCAKKPLICGLGGQIELAGFGGIFRQKGERTGQKQGVGPRQRPAEGVGDGDDSVGDGVQVVFGFQSERAAEVENNFHFSAGEFADAVGEESGRLRREWSWPRIRWSCPARRTAPRRKRPRPRRKLRREKRGGSSILLLCFFGKNKLSSPPGGGIPRRYCAAVLAPPLKTSPGRTSAGCLSFQVTRPSRTFTS